jgi:hypothetical protein
MASESLFSGLNRLRKNAGTRSSISVESHSHDSPGNEAPRSIPLHRRKPVPICGRPLACKSRRKSFDRIACSHMSGLLVRSPLTAGRDGFRDASSEHGSGTGIPLGTTDCLAFWIDRSHHLLFSSKLRLSGMRPVVSRRSGYVALSVPAATAWAGL